MVDRDGKIASHGTEKAEIFSKYCCSVFRKEVDDVFISNCDNEIPSMPTMTRQQITQHILILNIFKFAELDNLNPRVLKELSKELSKPQVLISEVSEYWGSSS